MTRERRQVACMLALTLGLVLPAPAVAQFDLSGWVGPVTISDYGACEDFFCADAAVGVGQNSSGRYFARLLTLNESFDAAGFDEAWPDTYVSHGLMWVELWYAEPHPRDPDEGEWHFLTDGGVERFTTTDYGTPVSPGLLTIGYMRTQDEGPWGSDALSMEKSIRLTVVGVGRVTTTPEPSMLALVGGGLVALLIGVRRRKYS